MEEIYMKSSPVGSFDNFGQTNEIYIIKTDKDSKNTGDDDNQSEYARKKSNQSATAKQFGNDRPFEAIRVYPYRWLILTLYSLTAFSNTLVWLSLFTVSDATCKFYRINESKLTLSSIFNTALQVLVAIPVTFLPSRLGLRTTMVIAAFINAVGACVMIGSTHRDGFAFFIGGQVVIALASSILPQLAPQVSAIWFDVKEHAVSTSIGIIIGNAGAAVGFLQPALMINNIEPEKHIDYIGEKLSQLIYSQAALCCLLFLLILVLFKNDPQLPPTLSQALRAKNTEMTLASFKNAYKVLLKDKNYILCANAFAVNSLLLFSVPLFLNGLVSWKYPNHDAEIGWMGFGGIISGIGGSIVFSIILDKYQAYRKMVLFLGVVTFALWIAFAETLAMVNNLHLVMILFIVCLFCFIPFGPVVVDMIAEMTYPISESISFVIPITAGRLYAVPVIFVLGWLIDQEKCHSACLIIAGVILVSLLFVLFPKVKRKRTEAGTEATDGRTV